jgi:hypothetical protein
VERVSVVHGGRGYDIGARKVTHIVEHACGG